MIEQLDDMMEDISTDLESFKQDNSSEVAHKVDTAIPAALPALD